MAETTVLLAVVGIILAAVGLWFAWRAHIRSSPAALDRAESKVVVQRFVRTCESQRVLWNDYLHEAPRACYAAVQELRKALREARGSLPATALGGANLDVMKQAAEEFCTDYEQRFRKQLGKTVFIHDFAPVLREFRTTFVPSLEDLRLMYNVDAGHRST